MMRAIRKCYWRRVLEVLLVSLVMVAVSSMTARADDDESFSESVVDLWHKVSGAAVKGSKVVKEKSVEFGKNVSDKSVKLGKEVSDKSVDAWEGAKDEVDDDAELEEGAFGDTSIGVGEPDPTAIADEPGVEGDAELGEGAFGDTRMGVGAADPTKIDDEPAVDDPTRE